jgi:hypothetical protein
MVSGLDTPISPQNDNFSSNMLTVTHCIAHDPDLTAGCNAGQRMGTMIAITKILLLQVDLPVHRPFEGILFGCLLLQDGSFLHAVLVLGSRDVHA